MGRKSSPGQRFVIVVDESKLPHWGTKRSVP